MPKRPRIARPVLAACLLCAGATAQAADYVETFDVLPDPAPVAAADWTIISGTNNPTTVSTDFSLNNSQNVIKITAVNDLGSQFTSAHVFSEHDYRTGAPGDGGSDPNSFGRGDLLLHTSEPVTRYGATAMDINGAFVSVDYANGNANNAGPSFYFAFKLAGGRWWIYETLRLGQTTAAVTHARMSTDPLDDTFTFIPLLTNDSGFNPDIRLIPDDSNARELTTEELSQVVAVGIYVYPSYDTGPSRFDNYSITGFRVLGGTTLPGDITGDGNVDIADYVVFADCMAGPGATPVPSPPATTAECLSAFDLNGDQDVDLADAATFFTLLTAG